ncbi:MAG: hypothetical protein SFU25_04380 [Candidatus Caenarcaniphilales bacterium]|nr:hypothetical protein [Candidatus Caenarcaniphilales bacterium]
MFSEELKNKLPDICNFFEAALLKNKLPHSFLFVGSDDSLKEEFALYLTKILNCVKNLECKTSFNQPCGQCSNCKWIEENTHPDLPIVLEPDLEKSKKGVVLVKQTQMLLSKLQVKSSFFRVIIIKKSESEHLPQEAANSLLKTIEEPNPNLIFLLFASDPEKVLPTIVSRCQIVSFPSLNHSVKLSEEVVSQEALSEVLSQNISFQRASQLGERYSKEFEINGLVNLFDSANSFFLQKYEADYNPKWLEKTKLCESAKLKVRAFCSSKHVLSEFFWRVTQ